MSTRAVRRILFSGTAIVMVVHAIVAAALASQFAPNAWVVSDPGAKFVAAENVLRHPARPLEVDLPALPADLAREWRQPYFIPHGNHTHPVTPQAFPILVAPFLWAFGLYGLVVLPILAWVTIGPASAKLAAAVGMDVRPSAVMTMSVIATPLMFYGLEFWEHAPAVACFVGAAALLLNRHARWVPQAAGGAFAMLAIQLRPEAAPAVLGIALVLILRRSPAALLALVAGAAAMGLPLVAYNLTHFGEISSPHVRENLAALSAHWMSERLRYAATWFAPARVTTTAAFAVIAAGWVLARMTRFRTVGTAIGVVAAMYLAFEMAWGHEHPANFFRVFPIALLALVPMATPSRVSRDLLLLVLVPLAGIWLTAPNDGASWGPRYLMPVVPLVMLMAVANMTELARRSWIAKAAVVWFVVTGVVASTSANRELRGTKRAYSRMVRETSAAATGTSHIVTTTWWVPASHAGVIDARTVVYVETAEQAARVLRALAPAEVLFVSEIEAPGFSAVDATTGTCYSAQPTRPHNIGRLQSARLVCK